MPSENKYNVIALIRHGDYHQPEQVPSALLPYPLTAQGRGQALAAAANIKMVASEYALEVDLTLHSSRQLRAWETATIMANELGSQFTVAEYPELSERSVGAVANLTVGQIEQILADDPRYAVPPNGWKSDSHYCLPFQGAESLIHAGQRVAGHVRHVAEQLEEAGTGKLKIIVGHGASIRHACAELNILDLKMVKSISMYHASPVYFSFRQGSWQHLTGEWKPRKGSNDGDEIRER
ncbi:MAG: histidine phosphatase family protein [Pseudomonadales bacterium]